MSLNVQIPDTFSGPLDLLLHLIRRDEMDIYDIPIAQLAAGYLEELSRMELVDVDEAAEFLDIASRLVEIKSRLLLPDEDRNDPDEDEEDLDPRAGLVKALLEYRRFKEAAELLRGLAEEQARRYPRIAPRPTLDVVEEPGKEDLDGSDLFAAFQALLYRLAPPDGANQVTYTEVPTTVRISQIENVLAEAGKTRFSLLLSGKPSRAEMVGFFIAMLELIRQGKMVARQGGPFGDIILEARTPALEELSRDTGQIRNIPSGKGSPAKAGRTARRPAPFPAASALRALAAVVKAGGNPVPMFPAGKPYGFGVRMKKANRTGGVPVFFAPCGVGRG